MKNKQIVSIFDQINLNDKNKEQILTSLLSYKNKKSFNWNFKKISVCLASLLIIFCVSYGYLVNKPIKNPSSPAIMRFSKTLEYDNKSYELTVDNYDIKEVEKNKGKLLIVTSDKKEVYENKKNKKELIVRENNEYSLYTLIK